MFVCFLPDLIDYSLQQILSLATWKMRLLSISMWHESWANLPFSYCKLSRESSCTHLVLCRLSVNICTSITLMRFSFWLWQVIHSPRGVSREWGGGGWRFTVRPTSTSTSPPWRMLGLTVPRHGTEVNSNRLRIEPQKSDGMLVLKNPTAWNLNWCFVLVLSSAATRPTCSGWIPTWPIEVHRARASVKALRDELSTVSALQLRQCWVMLKSHGTDNGSLSAGQPAIRLSRCCRQDKHRCDCSNRDVISAVYNIRTTSTVVCVQMYAVTFTTNFYFLTYQHLFATTSQWLNKRSFHIITFTSYMQ